MKKRLLAIDGNSILNRAFYGIRPLTTKDGFPTNALYGLVSMITRQEDAVHPDYRAVAFDLKAPTFRHKMFEGYKAGRRPMPEELALQLPVAKELMRALGYTVLETEGYEADDILGTLSAMCEREGVDAYLMTGDRDALQLISPSVHVLLATNHETEDVDEKAFFGKYGVPSSAFVDVKALMGDASDKIPGVPGIGEKTALSLIAQFGSLDAVYEHLEQAGLKPAAYRKMAEGKESAYLSQSLARICREVPLGIGFSDLATGKDTDALRKLFIRLEFAAFLNRFAASTAPSTEPPAGKAEIGTVSAEKFAALCNGTDAVALDFEENAIYLGVAETSYRFSGAFEELLPILAGKTVVVYDAKQFYKQPVLKGLRSLSLFDLMLGAYLVNSAKSKYEFPILTMDYLGELPAENVRRVTCFMRLYREIRRKLEESDQLSMMETVEMPLAAVLADMETVGFRIDREGIARYGEQLGELAQALEAQIYLQAGRPFNINSPKQLGEVLFDELRLPHDKKNKNGYSTSAEILEKLRPYHSIVQDILDYRQVTKLKGTYTDGLLKVADTNGRVHTTFKQTGTATGRLSSTEPNLQNIPIRTELGRELRRYFLPADGDVLIDADYSQIELRLLAHVSDDENMIRAFNAGVDIHTTTASAVFGVPEKEVTPEMRKRAKAVNFGIMYGIGAFSLADDIGVSRAQAKEYINQYFAGFPKVDAYLKRTIAEAYENGYVTTVFGRRRYIPELAGKNKVLQKFGERVAMNSPIQGTAADLIKLSMIRVHKRLAESGLDARLILQVHDELLIEAKRECAAEAEKILKEEMENVVRFSVPLTVEIHSAENWYDAK
ncbi:MAG: DNA polymerase I [Clostridia bacterium]|nr:DNA polymerase I [Clostridia bacterium]